MKRWLHRKVWDVQEINYRVTHDVKAFVAEENDRYRREVDDVADWLGQDVDGRKLVMLSGPSSSGKTTTSLFLRDRLTQLGIEAQVVSLDDFYRGRNLAPQLPDGSYDYEALEALNLDRLHQCMREILTAGRTALPVFDFHSGAPAPETRDLHIGNRAVVIFEGIHGLNPIFEQHLPQNSLYKIFVNTVSPIYQGDVKLLARRQLRLTRRILRDMRFRNSPIENTLDMWPQVVRGENAYMFPYVDTVDTLIDTTHAYEPCVLAGEIVPVLEHMDPAHPHAAVAADLLRSIQAFVPTSPDVMPRDSLLREFVGGGLY